MKWQNKLVLVIALFDGRSSTTAMVEAPPHQPINLSQEGQERFLQAKNILERDLEKNPSTTACVLKERNFGASEEMSIKTVSKYMHGLG